MRQAGLFFEPSSSKSRNGVIKITGGKASILVGKKTICRAIEIESIQGKRDIYLKNGYLFTLNAEMDAGRTELFNSKLRRGIFRLERFSIGKTLMLSLILVCSIVLFRIALTLITPYAVSIFPHEWEEVIGQNTYQSLESTIFDSSELSPARIERLREKTRAIIAANNLKSTEIIFHKSGLIGPNALAFPGGPIVVTDDLVLLLKEDDLVLSVIAHELAHVEERHSLHHIIEVIGVATIVLVLFGADESLIEEASTVGVSLWANKQSRDFEREADLTGLEYLKAANLDTSSFAKAIKIFTEHFCASDKADDIARCVNDAESGWLSSHPSGAERLNYLTNQ